MSTALANLAALRQQLAERLQSAQAQLPPSTSTRIQVTQDKQFKFPDGRASDEPFEAVILSYQWFNALYTKRYVPGQVESPDCWAADFNYANMAPSSAVKKPVHTECATCPKNEWGSDPTGGKGKACGNKVRLAIVPPDADASTPVWTLDLSPTAQGVFTKFLRDMFAAGRIVETMVVKIGFDPKVDFAKVIMQATRDIPESLLPAYAALKERADAVVGVDFNYE